MERLLESFDKRFVMYNKILSSISTFPYHKTLYRYSGPIDGLNCSLVKKLLRCGIAAFDSKGFASTFQNKIIQANQKSWEDGSSRYQKFLFQEPHTIQIRPNLTPWNCFHVSIFHRHGIQIRSCSDEILIDPELQRTDVVVPAERRVSIFGGKIEIWIDSSECIIGFCMGYLPFVLKIWERYGKKYWNHFCKKVSVMKSMQFSHSWGHM